MSGSQHTQYADAAPPAGRSAPTPTRVARRARTTEWDAVRAVLQWAFRNDPLYGWLYPDREARPHQLRPLFDVILGAAFARGAVWVLRDLSAAAVWADDAAEVITRDTVDRYLSLLAATVEPARIDAVTGAMAACAALAPTAPHSVLHSIGVPLHAQGAGAGSALLRQLLDRCDQRDRPAYLESSNPRNLRFYERHGFRLLGSVPLPGGVTGMTPMLRTLPSAPLTARLQHPWPGSAAASRRPDARPDPRTAVPRGMVRPAAVESSGTGSPRSAGPRRPH